MQETQLQKRTPELVEWNIAKRSIVPWLQAVEETEQNLPALTDTDFLVQMLTTKIKMTLACYLENRFVPLNTQILQSWAISVAALRLVMEENLFQISQTVRLEEHKVSDLEYYSIHCMLPYFNSLMPFYAPIQRQLLELFGSEFFFSVPERKTAIIFPAKHIGKYERFLQDDIYLTHECSSHSLSPELIQVDSEGVYPIF